MPGDYAVAPNQENVLIAPSTFAVEWVDEHVEEQATEAAYSFANDSVVFAVANGTFDGLRFEAPRDTTEQGSPAVFRVRCPVNANTATVADLYKSGPHAKPARFRVPDAERNVEPDAVPKKVHPSTRLRLSLYSMVPPFRDETAEDKMDHKQLDALADSGVDDVTLVYTYCLNEKSVGGKAFDATTASPALRVSNGITINDVDGYIQTLVAALHNLAHPVQLLIGFDQCHRQGTNTMPESEARFLDLLAQSEPKYIEGLGSAIVQKCLDLGADGVAFDVEIDGMAPEHAANLKLLYTNVATALARTNRILTYATAPFQADGDYGVKMLNTQPFALARDLPNVIARPMCYGNAPNGDGAIESRYIKSAIACALSRGATGGGLHPSQLQMVIPPNGADLTMLRMNRVGYAIYGFSAVKGETTDSEGHVVTHDPLYTLRSCKKRYDDVLNRGEAPPGTPGMPLQVPLGPLGIR